MRPQKRLLFRSHVLKPDPFDPEGAKKLTAEVGYPGGFNTAIWDIGGGGAVTNLNLAIAGHWRKLGINTEVQPMDYTLVRSNFNPKRTPETVGKVWTTISSGSVWQFEQMRTRYHSQNGANTNNKDDPKLDELIDKVGLMQASPEKTKLSLEAVVRARDGYEVLCFLDVQTLYAIGKQIGEFRPIKGSAVGLGLSHETMTHAK